MSLYHNLCLKHAIAGYCTYLYLGRIWMTSFLYIPQNHTQQLNHNYIWAIVSQGYKMSHYTHKICETISNLKSEPFQMRLMTGSVSNKLRIIHSVKNIIYWYFMHPLTIMNLLAMSSVKCLYAAYATAICSAPLAHRPVALLFSPVFR